MKSVRGLLGCASEAEVEAFLDGLSDNALLSLPYLFEHWAHAEHQLPPEGDWNTWVILGGRGAGKTRAGSEWVRAQVEGDGPYDKGRCRKVALVGETYDQTRDVMVFGESGILRSSPPDRRPEWQATRRRLVWPNGAEAQCFSASDPEALRGPQFDCAWVDELAKWKKGQEAWDMLQFALRLGDHPQQVVTTTPRTVAVLRDLLAAEGTVQTSAPTSVNRSFLAESFLEKITTRFGGTRIGRQEIEGELLSDHEGALWKLAMLDAVRIDVVPELTRVVVAVDPPVTSNKLSDECGIIVAGVVAEGPPKDWKAYVLADASMAGATPAEWAERAVRMVHAHGADRLVAEVNQGGDLVESIVRQVDPMVSYRGVRALEDQMCEMSAQGYLGAGSPDRVDALVWALTDLMIDPSAGWQAPRVRRL